MPKTLIFVKIFIFCFFLHLAQLSVALGRYTLKTSYNSQRMEEILNSWDGTNRAECFELFVGFYSQKTELEAFQSWDATDLVFQYLARTEDEPIQKWMVTGAVAIADRRDKLRKSCLGWGTPWYEIPLGFHCRHWFNLTTLEKFNLEDLRDLVCGMRHGTVEVERKDLEP